MHVHGPRTPQKVQMGSKHMGQHYLGSIGGEVVVQNRVLEGENGLKTWIIRAQKCCFWPEKGTLTPDDQNKPSITVFKYYLAHWNQKISFLHSKLRYWLFLPILGLLWQIGLRKMAINCIFLDLGPPKRCQWGPNTWANIICGQCGVGAGLWVMEKHHHKPDIPKISKFNYK